MKFKIRKNISEAFWESSYGFVSREAYNEFKEVNNLLNKELSEYDSLIDNLENNAITDEEKEALESNTVYKTLISKYNDSYEIIESLSKMFEENLIQIEDNPYDNNILIDSTIYSVSDLYDLLNDLKETKSNLDKVNEKMKFKIRKNINEARYSDAYDDDRRQQGWWYFTTHGVMPGSIPKGLNVLDTKEGENSKGTLGTFVKLDGILNTSELRQYDMKEETPKSGRVRTWEFDDIRIVDKPSKFDTFIRNDAVDEYSYYQTPEGEIVAVINESLNEEKYVDTANNKTCTIIGTRKTVKDYRNRLDSFEDEDIVIQYDNEPRKFTFSKGEFLTRFIPLNEDTIKQNGKWVNKGKEGTHGKFKTKKAADAQRKAMFANGYKESLEKSTGMKFKVRKNINEALQGYGELYSEKEFNRVYPIVVKIATEEFDQADDEWLEEITDQILSDNGEGLSEEEIYEQVSLFFDEEDTWDESLNEASEQDNFKLYIFLNTAATERRPLQPEDIEDFIEEEPANEEEFFEAIEDLGVVDLEDIRTEEELINWLEGQDYGFGDPIIYKAIFKGATIYDDSDYFESIKADLESGDYEESLNEKLVDVSDELLKEFEDILAKHNFSVEDRGRTFMGNIHYQIIDDTKTQVNSSDELIDFVTPLVDDIEEFDNANNIPITWNFGVNKDGVITAGLDLDKQYIDESFTGGYPYEPVDYAYYNVYDEDDNIVDMISGSKEEIEDIMNSQYPGCYCKKNDSSDLFRDYTSYNESLNEAKKKDIIKAIRTTRIPEGDIFQVGDAQTGWTAQIQNHGVHEVHIDSKRRKSDNREKSGAWGRIWKNKKFVKSFEGPLNVVRDEMIKFLQSKGVTEGLSEDYSDIYATRINRCTCPHCQNRGTLELIDFLDDYVVCNECGAEYEALEQYDGSFKFKDWDHGYAPGGRDDLEITYGRDYDPDYDPFFDESLNEGKINEFVNYNGTGGRYFHYNDAKLITHDNPDSDVFYTVQGEYKVYRMFGSKEEAWDYYVNRMNKLPRTVTIAEKNKNTGRKNWSESFINGELVSWSENGRYGAPNSINNPEFPKLRLQSITQKDSSILDGVEPYISYNYKPKIKTESLEEDWKVTDYGDNIYVDDKEEDREYCVDNGEGEMYFTKFQDAVDYANENKVDTIKLTGRYTSRGKDQVWTRDENGNFNESLDESFDDDFFSLVIEWIMEHDEAADDFVNYFHLNDVADETEGFISPSDMKNSGISVEDVLGWISDHPLLADDFENHFNISLYGEEDLPESLNEKLGDREDIQYEIHRYDNLAPRYSKQSIIDELMDAGYSYKEAEYIANHTTNLEESLDEASYGGAYDIEDDQFFTREEINEFAYDIVDRLASNFGKKYDVAGVYMETPTDLYISIIDENGYESYNTFPIDMRKIRSPKDLNKYAEVVTNWFTKDFNGEYEWERRAYGESFNESKEVLYVIKDKQGNQLSRPTPDDDELWDRVESMEARGKRGLKVVVYTDESLNEDRWEVVKDYKYQKGDELTIWWKTPSGETQYASVEYAGRDRDKNYKFISTTYGWTYLVSKDKDKVKMPNKDIWYDRISHGDNDSFPESLNEDIDEGDDEFYQATDGNYYKEIQSKTVYDVDGFTTDYTLYMKVTPDGKGTKVSFVTVFGDKELYRPEDEYYDFECSTAQEAFEWFENYNGVDEEPDNDIPELTQDDMQAGQWYESLKEALYLKERYVEYDPEDAWSEEDIELHKSIDWAARNYTDYDAGEPITRKVILYGDGEPKTAEVEMHKFLRANAIFPPYYKPVMEKPFGMDVSYVGPMYDGNDYEQYQIHDRYETQDVYDMLSDSLDQSTDKKTISEKLNDIEVKNIDKGYWDLKNIYESIQDKLTPQEKQELKQKLDDTDDPELISAYLNQKMNKKPGAENESNQGKL